MIHPSAVIEPGAQLGANVEVGAFAYIGPQVVIGDNCKIYPQAYLTGDTHLGEGCKVFPFAVVGEVPQDVKYANEPTKTRIGKNNVIREHVTVHAGTVQDQGITQIGDNNLIMIGVHVAHDVIIHNNTIIVNNTILGGHVEVDDFAVIGGGTGVHQFVHIGQHAMIGGMSAIDRDVVPFSLCMSERSKVTGLNLIGLKRRGFNREQVAEIKEGMRSIFFGDGGLEERLAALEATGQASTQELVQFVKNSTKRGLTMADANARF